MARSRLVVLVSGSGTNLQALLDASGDPAYGAEVVAVGADRHGTRGQERAAAMGVATFVTRVGDHASRDEWDRALSDEVAALAPDLVVLAGFMKLVGPEFLSRFGGRTVNTHPALSPSFPGMHGPAEALAYGVKVTGCTLFVVDGGCRHRPDRRPAGGRGRGRRHRGHLARADQGVRAGRCSWTPFGGWRARAGGSKVAGC